jgi:hypothetical protein
MNIQKLLASMRQNEALYTNIEAEYMIDRRTLLDDDRTKKMPYIRHGTTKHHVIFQGLSYYARIQDDFELTNGEHGAYVTEIGCDGEVTRTNQQGAFGNIDHSRLPPRSFFSPHKLGYPEISEHGLADYVEFTPAFSEDSNYPTLTIRSRVVDSAEIGGLDCVKVECADHGRPPEAQPRALTFLWICPSRNFLPVRCERYWHRFSASLPVVTYEVGDWHEAAPGMCIPCTGTSMIFDGSELKKGVSMPASRAVIKVKGVRVDPRYEIEKFRQIEMPKNKPIHTIRGGEIVLTEVLYDGPDGTTLSREVPGGCAGP